MIFQHGGRAPEPCAPFALLGFYYSDKVTTKIVNYGEAGDFLQGLLVRKGNFVVTPMWAFGFPRVLWPSRSVDMSH